MSSATNIQTIQSLLADPWWTIPRLRACCWRTDGRERHTVAQQLGVGVSTLKDWERHASFQALRQALLQEELQHQQAARTHQEQLQDTALSLLEARLKDATQRPEAHSHADVIGLLQASGQPPLPDEMPGPGQDPQPSLPRSSLHPEVPQPPLHGAYSLPCPCSSLTTAAATSGP